MIAMNYRMIFPSVDFFSKKHLKNTFWGVILFLLNILLFSAVGFSQTIPERPNPPRLVNDFANLIGPQAQQLEQKLVAYNDSTSTQITIVTVTTLNGYAASDFATELGHKWGVGRKGRDNGLVILLAKQERDVFIATGYGMEEKIPDAIASRLVRNVLIPHFKDGKFYEGLDEATDEIIARLSGTYTAMPSAGQGNGKGIPAIMVIIIVIAIILLISFLGGGGSGGQTIGRSGPTIYRGPFMGGGFGGGGFGGGGIGGGGFGGFGGGGFGGGGAGGRW
jgi:uncharacterized protein